MSQTSVVTLKGTLLNSVFYSFHVNWKRFTTFSLLIESVGYKTGFMLINSTCVEKYQQGSHALVWIDHSTRPEDSGCSSPDLSPASLFLPPYFNKTLIIFPQLCFSPFCFRPPPPPLYFSLALSGERYAVAPKSRGCGSMGIFQHRDNRIAALTGAIELIRRPGSDNVITAVLRPLISPPPPNLLCLRSRRWEEEGGGHRALFQ